MSLLRRPRVIGTSGERLARRSALTQDARAGRVRRVLAVRFGRIGDVLFTTPALSRLAEALPDARIDYCTSGAGVALVDVHPAVRDVLRFDPGAHRPGYLLRRAALRRELTRRGYDLVLIFESDHPTRFWLEQLARRAGVRHVVSRSSFAADGAKGRALHSCERHMQLLEMLGIERDERSYELFVAPRQAQLAADFLRERGLASQGAPGRPPVLGLQPGCHYSRWPGARALPGLRHKFHKTWPEAHWSALAQLVVDRLGGRVVLFGAGYERVMAQRIAAAVRAPAGREPLVTAGETSVGLLAALLARMDAVVSIDTGTMHMAAALGVPTVALFGPTNPVHHGPYRRPQTARVLRTGIACSPCAKPARRRCPANACLRQLAPERALEAAAALLASAARPPADQSRRAANAEFGR
jgi:heptosyltransferase-2